MSLKNKLRELVAACFTGIWIETHESQDAIDEITGMCGDEQWRLATWDIDQGLRISGSDTVIEACLLYTSPSPRDRQKSRMPSSA